MRRMRWMAAAVALVALVGVGVASAADPKEIPVTIENNKFSIQ